MGLRMWKQGKSNDFTMFDKVIGEQFNMGGVDMWIYTYSGPDRKNNKNDPTVDDDITEQGGVSSIGDIVLGETAYRNYNLDAITIPCVYQVIDATPDLKMSGLVFNPMKMAITVHYNTMIQRIGRKLKPGDVLELPNLRDVDVEGIDTGINRFYVVVDAFRSADGYSATWQNHIFKVRVDPLTNSPEYENLLGNNEYSGTDINDPNYPDGSIGNGSSGSVIGGTFDKEMEIMNKIVFQGDEDMSYLHWTNEHIFDDYKDKAFMIDKILKGYNYPSEAPKDLFFIKQYYPKLYYKEGESWIYEPTDNGYEFPEEPYDGQFFFKFSNNSVSSWMLYQYNIQYNKFLLCDLPFSNNEDDLPLDVEFYYSCQVDALMQFNGAEWIHITNDPSTHTFSTKDVVGIKNNIANRREAIPPARGTVGEGKYFPDNPKDGDYFYRTDYTPVTLWKYNSKDNLWSQFNYGGRQPWTGANKEQTDYLNSDDRVSIHDVLKPNIIYRKK